MDLQSNASLSGSDLFIVDVDHLLTVQPSLDIVSLYFDTHGVPVTLFQDIFFFIRDLDQPAASVWFIDAACVMAFGSYFYLPAVYFNILFDKGTDEYAGVSVCFLFEFNR